MTLFEDKKQYKVLDLLQIVGERGYSDSDIKEAIARLLHERQLELTSDRQLRSIAAAA
jgi:hypothetical protein